VRDFVVKHKNTLKMAFNFHAWGNLLIYPFNYDSPANNALYDKYPEQALIYDEISRDTNLPEGNIKGNAMQAIRYSANGEASDWMLGVHGIVAMSPELGTKDRDSEDFFIRDAGTLKSIIVENAKWIWSVSKKMQA
jgi:Zinc carboxypeptidase